MIPGARPRVVVVGAGPCGAVLALLLARAGWTVTLVEQVAPGAPRPYRGEGLMPSGVMVLEAMGLWPLPPQVRHRPLAGWAVVLERQSFFAVAEPLAGDRGCWLVDQESLLAHLRMELGARSDVRLLEGRPVRGLVRVDGTGGRVRVGGVVLADGTEVGADLVVACDGRDSSLRRLAGLGLQAARDPARDGAAGQERLGRSADAPVPDGQSDHDPPGRPREQVLWFRLAGDAVAPLERWLAGRFLTVVHAGVSFALFAEATGEALRLGWVAEPAVAPPADPAGWRESWAAALPEAAAALVRDLPLAAIEGPQRFPVRVGWASRWHAPGLLLLGDAAHPMSPVRAQGLNMALRDALGAARLLGPLGGQRFEACPVGVPMHSEPPRDSGVPRPGAPEPVADALMSGDVLDALLPRLAALRLPEIRQLQVLQAEEAGLGALLRQRHGLRRALAATASWSGPLARWRWIQRQHRLRQGLPEALPLPE